MFVDEDVARVTHLRQAHGSDMELYIIYTPPSGRLTEAKRIYAKASTERDHVRRVAHFWRSEPQGIPLKVARQRWDIIVIDAPNGEPAYVAFVYIYSF